MKYLASSPAPRALLRLLAVLPVVLAVAYVVVRLAQVVETLPR